MCPLIRIWRFEYLTSHEKGTQLMDSFIIKESKVLSNNHLIVVLYIIDS
jgi:hypothetical protein